MFEAKGAQMRTALKHYQNGKPWDFGSLGLNDTMSLNAPAKHVHDFMNIDDDCIRRPLVKYHSTTIGGWDELYNGKANEPGEKSQRSFISPERSVIMTISNLRRAMLTETVSRSLSRRCWSVISLFRRARRCERGCSKSPTEPRLSFVLGM